MADDKDTNFILFVTPLVDVRRKIRKIFTDICKVKNNGEKTKKTKSICDSIIEKLSAIMEITKCVLSMLHNVSSNRNITIIFLNVRNIALP